MVKKASVIRLTWLGQLRSLQVFQSSLWIAILYFLWVLNFNSICNRSRPLKGLFVKYLIVHGIPEQDRMPFQLILIWHLMLTTSSG